MNHEELEYYIRCRNAQLSSDELLEVLDISKNPQLNHIIYENGVWTAWDTNGHYYEFRKRNW